MPKGSVTDTGAVPDQLITAYQGNPMNMMASAPVRSDWPLATSGQAGSAAAMTGNGIAEDLMTRRQVAFMFGVTSAAVASWARRGRLPEIRDQAGKPRYRRADVETLFRSGLRRRT